MCTETADQSKSTENVLHFINKIFLLIFTIECVMKLLALKWRYFKIPWNIFDFTVVVSSLLGIKKKTNFELKLVFICFKI